ncbi:MAG TPA: hypothetical protein VGS03_11340 [Candidatus Polarisedimenticolia bacterium]|nr:hypothetical protein [Candidatus Polarisedimenticolia bacterium]
MRHPRAAFLLACVGILFVAVASAPAQTGASPVGPALAPSDDVGPAAAPEDGAAPDAAQPCPPLPPAPEDQFTPVACRRAPECSTDDDCTALCGPNGGKCVHSNCPVRICKCR